MVSGDPATMRNGLESTVSPTVASFAIMHRVFRRFATVFTAFVKSSMQRVYGGEHWLSAVKASLGPRMRTYCREKGLWDVYIVCEVLLDHLDCAFIAQAEDIDNIVRGGAFLEQVAKEIDTVAQSRNWMFHTEGLSPNEALRCMLVVKKLVKRFSIHIPAEESICSPFEDEIKVGSRQNDSYIL